MIDIVKNTCLREKLINKGDGIVVALSGGPDSVAMLYSLYLLKEEFEINLVAVHLNHMFRGKNSDADEDYTISLCKKLNIDIRTFRTDVSKLAKDMSMSFEEAGRYERYRLFNQVMLEYGFNKIAVAQNLNDQVETILMRIIRGTGMTGLRGISYKRDDYIIRPILDVDRHIVESFCLENKLEPRIDHTNFEDIYFRNKVRLKLLPLLKSEFSSAINDSLIRTSNLISEDDEYLNTVSNDLMKDVFQVTNCEYITLIEKFNEIHIAIKRRILRKIIFEINGNLNDLSFALINEIITMFDRKTHGSKIVWNDIKFEISYDKIIIKRSGYEKHNWKFSLEVHNVENIDINTKDKYRVCLDYDLVVGNVYLRYRENGDKFSPLGLIGSKKLKDYFIDKKIPKDIRDDVPLLCDEEGILWIAGHTIDNRARVTNSTKKIVELKAW